MAKVLHLKQLLTAYPFPPVTIPERMVWTSSSIKLFRRCKRKWFWKYILRLKPKYQDKHLMIGKAFHAAMGEWYSGKRSSMQQIVKPHVAALRSESTVNAEYCDQDDFDKLTTMIECFSGMMMGYEEVYAQDRLKWNIVRESIERQFKINMGEFDFAGKMDLVTHDKARKTNMLVEHKTAYRIGEAYVDRLPLDIQIRAYIFGASHPQGLNLPINEVLYDVIQKCKLRRKSNEGQDTFNRRIADDYIGRPDFYFYREPIVFAPEDIDAFVYELHQVHKEYSAIIRHTPRQLTNVKQVAEILGAEYDTNQKDAMDPWAWATDDGECTAWFRLCEYHKLCISGLDRGTGMDYRQGEMHEELAEENPE